MQPSPPGSSARPSYEETADCYSSHFQNGPGSSDALRQKQYDILVNQYYDLATEFYLFGWGRSFHFAPLHRGDRLRQALLRFEQFLAHELALAGGEEVLDLGCGVGGPMMTIASFANVRITGINNNEYQIGKGREFARRAGLDPQCRFVKADFMELPFPENSFDAAYSIEAVPHAPCKLALFREIHRVLRPGGQFAATDWCLTDRFHAADSAQGRQLTDLLRGNGLQGLATTAASTEALAEAGFEVTAARDLALDSHPDTPWYRPLDGTGGGWRSLVRCRRGRRIVTKSLRLLEKARLVPQGSAFVQEFLGWGADALVALGRAGAFTPMFYLRGRKPEA